MPVTPATGEAEAGESLEPGRQRYDKLRSRHCTPAWATSETPSQKQKKYVSILNVLKVRIYHGYVREYTRSQKICPAVGRNVN